jgi:DNA-binding transcriptional LysR family regulator
LLRGRAEIIEHQMLDFTRFTQTRETFAGSVTVTAPPDLLSEVLTPVLIEFKKKYPEVELRLFGDTREANLSKGEADIALRMTEARGSELVTQKICNVTYHFYGNEDIEKADPKSRRFIGYSDPHQGYLNDVTRRQAGNRPVALRTSNLRVSMAAACEGVGVALLPAFLAASRPQLRVVCDPPAPLTRAIYLVMQRDMRNSYRVRALADHILGKLPKLL